MSKLRTETVQKEYSLVREQLLSKLNSLGLTSYSAKAFLAIVENHPVSATTLCNVTGIPDSKIYYALKDLEERNLVVPQHGNPTLFKPLSAEKILSGLQAHIEQESRKKTETVKELERALRPMAERNETEAGNLDLAYVIKGDRNIVEKMKELTNNARREIVFLGSSTIVSRGIQESLRAKSSKVRLKIAFTKNVPKEVADDLRSSKVHGCDCDILVVDSEKLITASGVGTAQSYAILTQDRGMIEMSKGYYDNPKCCG